MDRHGAARRIHRRPPSGIDDRERVASGGRPRGPVARGPGPVGRGEPRGGWCHEGRDEVERPHLRRGQVARRRPLLEHRQHARRTKQVSVGDGIREEVDVRRDQSPVGPVGGLGGGKHPQGAVGEHRHGIVVCIEHHPGPRPGAVERHLVAMPVAEAVPPVVKVARRARREGAHGGDALGGVAVVHQGVDPAAGIDVLPLGVHQAASLGNRPHHQSGRRDRDLRAGRLRGDHRAGVVPPGQPLVVRVGVAEIVVGAVATAVHVLPPDERHVIAIAAVHGEAVRVGGPRPAAGAGIGAGARVVHEGVAPGGGGGRAVVVAGLPVAGRTRPVAVEEAQRAVRVADEVRIGDAGEGLAAHLGRFRAEHGRRPGTRRAGRNVGR